jgi:hypothetical protein
MVDNKHLDMTGPLAKLCHELACRVLERQRGLNSPARRLELASQIEAAIEAYLAFEKRKGRPALRKTKLSID